MVGSRSHAVLQTPAAVAENASSDRLSLLGVGGLAMAASALSLPNLLKRTNGSSNKFL